MAGFEDVEKVFQEVARTKQPIRIGGRLDKPWTTRAEVITWRRRAYAYRERLYKEALQLPRSHPRYGERPYSNIMIRMPQGAFYCVVEENVYDIDLVNHITGELIGSVRSASSERTTAGYMVDGVEIPEEIYHRMLADGTITSDGRLTPSPAGADIEAAATPVLSDQELREAFERGEDLI